MKMVEEGGAESSFEDVPFFCLKCGKIDEVIVDGYYFGDKLLEGVEFIVKNVNGEPKVMNDFEVDPYMIQLNIPYWIRECEDFCMQHDIASCSKCGEEVLVWGEI